MMPDIEKVKQGLRCCVVRHPDDKVRCAECPYNDPIAYCLNRLKNDALQAVEALSVALGATTSTELDDNETEGNT